MTTQLNGRCHCGQVTVTIPEDAFGIVACHCGDCQKLHGNFFAMLAVDTANVTWTGDIQTYASSPKANRTFCKNCGSRLAKLPVDGAKTLVSAGLFDAHLARRIRKNVFAESKPDWYELPQEES
ncbi:MAG: GFA family protein [bacterium]